MLHPNLSLELLHLKNAILKQASQASSQDFKGVRLQFCTLDAPKGFEASKLLPPAIWLEFQGLETGMHSMDALLSSWIFARRTEHKHTPDASLALALLWARFLNAFEDPSLLSLGKASLKKLKHPSIENAGIQAWQLGIKLCLQPSKQNVQEHVFTGAHLLDESLGHQNRPQHDVETAFQEDH